MPRTGGCPNCGSFLVMERYPDDKPGAFRLMTQDEVIELPDEERIRLQGVRRGAEQRNPNMRKH